MGVWQMTENKNALPGAGTPNRAMEQGAACEGVSNSEFQYTTIPEKWQGGAVSCLLAMGQVNAIPLRHLKSLMVGWTGREIRREIERERRSGIPILSDNTCGTGGYFLPANRSKLDNFVNSMYGRAMEIAKTAAAVEAAAVRE